MSMHYSKGIFRICPNVDSFSFCHFQRPSQGYNFCLLCQRPSGQGFWFNYLVSGGNGIPHLTVFWFLKAASICEPGILCILKWLFSSPRFSPWEKKLSFQGMFRVLLLLQVQVSGRWLPFFLSQVHVVLWIFRIPSTSVGVIPAQLSVGRLGTHLILENLTSLLSTAYSPPQFQ